MHGMCTIRVSYITGFSNSNIILGYPPIWVRSFNTGAKLTFSESLDNFCDTKGRLHHGGRLREGMESS